MVLLLVSGIPVKAQPQPQIQLPYPEPTGRFDIDSALIASPVKYSLSLKRRAKTQILFPDSLYDFAPFEVRTRKWYPTRLQNDSTWVDSAVYELMCFSGAPELPLSLPVFYLLPGGDSLPVYARTQVLHQRLLKTDSQADTLQPAIQTLSVQERFNYPYWIIGLSLFVGLIAIANIFFGKPVQRFFRIWVEGQRHRAFIRTFDKLVVQIQPQTTTTVGMEKALNLWKAYIERVEEIPYTTYTTKDFAEHLPDPALTQSLQRLDKYIYGGFPPEEADTAYTVLRQMAVRIYTQKSQTLRHG